MILIMYSSRKNNNNYPLVQPVISIDKVKHIYRSSRGRRVKTNTLISIHGLFLGSSLLAHETY